MRCLDQEGLRYHPVIPHVQRVAGRDDMLPLSRPITTESGGVISEIVVPKGTRIVASIAAYNRLAVLFTYICAASFISAGISQQS